MEKIWKFIYFYIVLNIVELCSGLPINTLSPNGWNGQTVVLFLAVVLSVCGLIFLVGCVCCQRRQGFKEFRDSPVSASVVCEPSEDDPGHVNPIATSEFTIFTPLSPPHHNNNVFRSNQARVPTDGVPEPACKVNTNGLDLRNWFDGSGFEFPRSKLKYIRELGSGWFGRVVEGEAQGIKEEQVWTPVAVRILETCASAHEQTLFLNEASMYRLEQPHPNVLKLLGHSLEATPLLLIQEYCPRGDLKKFLLENANNANSAVVMNLPLRFCCQVTAALQYLHENNMSHPDLAARTCQLTSDLTVKLGDYGIAVQQYPRDYYQGVPAVPVRWCAPEMLNFTNTTLQPNQMTPEGNIWSLGVTMWEITEWGNQPYEWLSDDEVISQVLGPPNVRLPKPDKFVAFYIDHLYRLMELCWTSSSQRPDVYHINDMLTHLLQVSNNSTPLKTRDFSVEDFDSRWDNFKPNTIVKTDNHVAELTVPDKNADVSSTSSIGEAYSETKKSESLTNLHGSFDNLLVDEETATPNTELDSWLQNIASNTGDMQYVQGLSQAIHALDSALASEQTSSSSSSYGRSPENWETQNAQPKIEFKLGAPVDRNSTFNTSSNEPSSLMDSILFARNESGSETEDETWKKRIERGAYSEKVRQKSKSVADLMILTHIDCSDTDSETPLQSLELKNTPPAYKNVRCSSRGMETSMTYGSEGNLLTVQDTFQEELRKLQEERRDSLLFVPAQYTSQEDLINVEPDFSTNIETPREMGSYMPERNISDMFLEGERSNNPFQTKITKIDSELLHNAEAKIEISAIPKEEMSVHSETKDKTIEETKQMKIETVVPTIEAPVAKERKMIEEVPQIIERNVPEKPIVKERKVIEEVPRTTEEKPVVKPRQIIEEKPQIKERHIIEEVPIIKERKTMAETSDSNKTSEALEKKEYIISNIDPFEDVKVSTPRTEESIYEEPKTIEDLIIPERRQTIETEPEKIQEKISEEVLVPQESSTVEEVKKGMLEEFIVPKRVDRSVVNDFLNFERQICDVQAIKPSEKTEESVTQADKTKEDQITVEKTIDNQTAEPQKPTISLTSEDFSEIVRESQTLDEPTTPVLQSSSSLDEDIRKDIYADYDLKQARNESDYQTDVESDRSTAKNPIKQPSEEIKTDESSGTNESAHASVELTHSTGKSEEQIGFNKDDQIEDIVPESKNEEIKVEERIIEQTKESPIVEKTIEETIESPIVEETIVSKTIERQTSEDPLTSQNKPEITSKLSLLDSVVIDKSVLKNVSDFLESERSFVALEQPIEALIDLPEVKSDLQSSENPYEGLEEVVEEIITPRHSAGCPCCQNFEPIPFKKSSKEGSGENISIVDEEAILSQIIPPESQNIESEHPLFDDVQSQIPPKILVEEKFMSDQAASLKQSPLEYKILDEVPLEVKEKSHDLFGQIIPISESQMIPVSDMEVLDFRLSSKLEEEPRKRLIRSSTFDVEYVEKDDAFVVSKIDDSFSDVDRPVPTFSTFGVASRPSVELEMPALPQVEDKLTEDQLFDDFFQNKTSFDDKKSDYDYAFDTQLPNISSSEEKVAELLNFEDIFDPMQPTEKPSEDVLNFDDIFAPELTKQPSDETKGDILKFDDVFAPQKVQKSVSFEATKDILKFDDVFQPEFKPKTTEEQKTTSKDDTESQIELDLPKITPLSSLDDVLLRIEGTFKPLRTLSEEKAEEMSQAKEEAQKITNSSSLDKIEETITPVPESSEHKIEELFKLREELSSLDVESKIEESVVPKIEEQPEKPTNLSNEELAKLQKELSVLDVESKIEESLVPITEEKIQKSGGVKEDSSKEELLKLKKEFSALDVESKLEDILPVTEESADFKDKSSEELSKLRQELSVLDVESKIEENIQPVTQEVIETSMVPEKSSTKEEIPKKWTPLSSFDDAPFKIEDKIESAKPKTEETIDTSKTTPVYTFEDDLLKIEDKISPTIKENVEEKSELPPVYTFDDDLLRIQENIKPTDIAIGKALEEKLESSPEEEIFKITPLSSFDDDFLKSEDLKSVEISTLTEEKLAESPKETVFSKLTPVSSLEDDFVGVIGDTGVKIEEPVQREEAKILESSPKKEENAKPVSSKDNIDETFLVVPSEATEEPAKPTEEATNKLTPYSSFEEVFSRIKEIVYENSDSNESTTPKTTPHVSFDDLVSQIEESVSHGHGTETKEDGSKITPQSSIEMLMKIEENDTPIDKVKETKMPKEENKMTPQSSIELLMKIEDNDTRDKVQEHKEKEKEIEPPKEEIVNKITTQSSIELLMKIEESTAPRIEENITLKSEEKVIDFKTPEFKEEISKITPQSSVDDVAKIEENIIQISSEKNEEIKTPIVENVIEIPEFKEEISKITPQSSLELLMKIEENVAPVISEKIEEITVPESSENVEKEAKEQLEVKEEITTKLTPQSSLEDALTKNLPTPEKSVELQQEKQPEKSKQMAERPITITRNIITSVGDFLDKERSYSEPCEENKKPVVEKTEKPITPLASTHSLLDFNVLTDTTSVKPQVFNVFNVTIDHKTPDFMYQGLEDSYMKKLTEKKNSVCTSSLQKEPLLSILENKPLLNGYTSEFDILDLKERNCLENNKKCNKPPKLSDIILEKLKDVDTTNCVDLDICNDEEEMNKTNDSIVENHVQSNMFTSTPFIKRVNPKPVNKDNIFSYISEGDENNQSSVILGPCEDYTLELYSGLKTTFEKYCDSNDDRPEEEILQFSSNFMPFDSEYISAPHLEGGDTPNVDYSLETWDKFLGKTLEDNEKTYNTFSPRLDSLNVDSFNVEVTLNKDEPKESVVNETYVTPNDQTQVINKNDEDKSVVDQTFDVKANATFTNDKPSKALDTTYDAPQSSKDPEPNATFALDKTIDKPLDQTYEKPPTDVVANSWEPGVGWFLHPQSSPEELTGQMDMYPEEVDNSYIGFTLDEECVNALRTELAAKLPHAQGIANEELEPEEFDGEERNEVLVKYNVYATPLSPIPEESCCEDVFYEQTQHRDGSDSESDWSEPGRTSHLEDILIVDTETHTALILESPSPREPLNRHTPSQDSCCSNDTLFNLEDLNYGPLEQEQSPVHTRIILNDEAQSVLQIVTPTPEENTPVNLSISEPKEEESVTKEETTKIDNEENHENDKSKLKLTLQPGDSNVAPLPSPEDIPWRQLPASMLTYSQVALNDTYDMPSENTGSGATSDGQEIVLEHDFDIEPKEEGISEEEDDVDPEGDTEADLYNNLTDIRFSGPCDTQLMSTSFSESAEIAEDRDWDSGSDTRSSSSGEFIWKEGEHEESLRALHHDEGVVENASPMDAIAEETSDTSDEDDDEEIEETEFVPSAWDSQATPTKSALRSPEKTNKSKTQKGVWFKKEKYHCVYEYPREPESPVPQSSDLWRPLSDFSNYADLWELDPESCIPAIDDDGKECYESSRRYTPRDYYQLASGSSQHRDLYQLNNSFPDFSSGTPAVDEDFFISSSAKPFQPLSNSSQFFPGNKAPWQEYAQSSLPSGRDFSDNITPDSGIDDATPASISEQASLSYTQLSPPKNKVQTLKSLAALAANKGNEVKESLGGLRHTRSRLKLDLPPSPSSFTSTRSFNIELNNDPIINREVPTFTTFGKSRFSVQHVQTPTEEENQGSFPVKNVSFEALPHKPFKLEEVKTKYVTTISENDDNHKPVEVVRGEASLLDSADEDSGIESSAHATLERQQVLN